MKKLYDCIAELKGFSEKYSREELEKMYQELAEWCQVGPTVDEFHKNVLKYFYIPNNYPEKWVTQLICDQWSEINIFIKQFQNDGTIEVFTQGFCYYFAKILSTRFVYFYNEPLIMYNPIDNHFACLILDKLWDITGELDVTVGTTFNRARETSKNVDNWYCWDNYKDFDNKDYERVVRDCIIKKN